MLRLSGVYASRNLCASPEKGPSRYPFSKTYIMEKVILILVVLSQAMWVTVDAFQLRISSGDHDKTLIQK
jgi:hypothetical protein